MNENLREDIKELTKLFYELKIDYVKNAEKIELMSYQLQDIKTEVGKINTNVAADSKSIRSLFRLTHIVTGGAITVMSILGFFFAYSRPDIIVLMKLLLHK